MENMDLLRHTDTVNSLLARYGVKFGIYKNGTFKEQLFPFDAIPREITKEEFDYLVGLGADLFQGYYLARPA